MNETSAATAADKKLSSRQARAHPNTVMQMLFSFVLTKYSFRRLYTLEFIIIFQWLPHTIHSDSKLCRLLFGTRNAAAFINMKSSVFLRVRVKQRP